MSEVKWGKSILWGLLAALGLAAAGVYYVFHDTDQVMAGSSAKQTISWLGGIRSAVQVYYGDTEGKAFPGSLDELTKNAKYLPEIPRARIYAKTKKGYFDRVHRGSETQTKIFRSSSEADDTGGWGYVADPASGEYGQVFINCTHLYMGRGDDKGVPWNTL